MALVITIGRSSDNDLMLNFPEISGHHAQLITGDAGEYVLEDLGSTNGTFVNGSKIKKTAITQRDNIKFAHYQFSLQKLLAASEDKKVISVKEVTFSDEFNQLKNVYADYVKKKLNIMQGNKKNTIIRGVLSFIPVVGNGLGQISGSFMDKQEKLMLLEEDFKTNYCCPKCSQFLGNVPWVNLAKRNTCIFCKEVWMK